MRLGVRLGVDVGSVRVGVAVCDPAGILATPLLTLERRKDGRDLASLAALATERAVVEIVVGLPTGLSGRAGAAAQAATVYAQALAALVAPVGVRLVDERFTTVAATRSLRAAGRNTRAGRAVVDQAAAAIILQNALDKERVSGLPPGQLVASTASDTTKAET